MSGFLLDINVVSESVSAKPDANVFRWMSEADESLVYLSVLTLGEIRKGIEKRPAGKRRAQLEAWLELALRPRFEGRILPVLEEIADRWGAITALADSRGKPLPVVDGLLAATALHHNLTLVTRNVSNFAGAAVPTFNPWREGG